MAAMQMSSEISFFFAGIVAGSIAVTTAFLWLGLLTIS